VLSVDSQHDVLALALVDLAYLDLLKNQPDAAIEHLERAKPIMLPRDRALMRVAYWYRGQVEPDYHDHPSGFMLVSTAVSANLVSAHLAVGRAEAAQELAQHMIDSRPNSRWGYKMLGLVLSALSDSDGARRAWLRASELAQKFGDEQAQVARWIAELPS
jgi:tetratricopeptide (TPR) repeat protein